MVDPCETVRMTGFNQPVHPFFLEAVDRLQKLRLILASQRISVLELYGITFKFELLIRTTSQLQGSSADHSFFLATELTAFEEICESHLLTWSYGGIGNERKEWSATNFRLVFIVFSSFEEMVALSRGVASSVTAIRHT